MMNIIIQPIDQIFIYIKMQKNYILPKSLYTQYLI